MPSQRIDGQWNLKAILVIGCVAVALVGLLVAFDAWKFPEEMFRRDRTEAEDLIQGGLVPKCASLTASDISVRYRIDAGEIWGAFRFTGNAFECPTVAVTPDGYPRHIGDDWWAPDPLPGPSATILSLPNERIFYAVVDSSGGHVYFWKLGGLSRRAPPF